MLTTETPTQQYPSLDELLSLASPEVNHFLLPKALDRLELQREAFSYYLTSQQSGRALSLLDNFAGTRNPELVRYALSVVDENFDGITEKIIFTNNRDTDFTELNLRLRLMDKMITWGNEEQERRAHTVLDKFLSQIKPHTIHSSDQSLILIPFALRYGNAILQEAARTKFIQLIESDTNPEGLQSNSALWRLINSDIATSDIEQIIFEYLEQFGLSRYDLESTWRIACKDSDYSSVLHKNLLTIRDIERASKGIAVRLYREQNIANFGRYPVALLLDQIAPPDSREITPFVLAQYDWNTAFYNRDKLYSSIFHQLHKTHRLKIVEIEPATKSDLPVIKDEKDWIRQARVFKRRIRQIAPKGTRSRFGIISVHGSGHFFHFGPGKSHLDYIPFLADENDEHLGFDCFGDDSIIVLSSCRSGFYDPKEWQHSIARNLSVITRSIVIGPEHECSLSELTIHEEEKSIKCHPIYKDRWGTIVLSYAYKDGKQVKFYLN